MKNIKQFLSLWYLSLLRVRLAYAVGAVGRISRRWHNFYHTTLSRTFWTLSQWERDYQAQVRRHLDITREGN